MENADNYKSVTTAYSSRISKNWWQIFSDSKLNSLMASLEKGNFDLRAAEGRRNQAYAALGIDRSELYPQLNSNTSVSRNRGSQNNLNAPPNNYFNDYRASMSLGYEIDLWGRVRRIVEAGQANSAAAEASLEQAKLSLQAQLASHYFALRFIDDEAAILQSAIQAREDFLKLTRELLDAGKSNELDIARAEAELANTKAQWISLQGPRANFENSIAILVGKNASSFSITQQQKNRSAPSISTGAPAELLGRRPDVFVAERKLAASSAEIGIAKANFYPRVSLIGNGGFSSIDSSDFLKLSSREFSIGPNVDLPIFRGFRNKSALALATAQHEEALAKYQQTVLIAFADVENALATRSAALKEIAAHQVSVKAFQKAMSLSQERYREGLTSFLEVIDSQRELLEAQLRETQARGRSFSATVQLIQALGGGFSN